jgi:hypothetical protein
MSQTGDVVLQEGDLFRLKVVLFAEFFVFAPFKQTLGFAHFEILLVIEVEVAAQGQIEGGYKEVL